MEWVVDKIPSSDLYSKKCISFLIIRKSSAYTFLFCIFFQFFYEDMGNAFSKEFWNEHFVPSLPQQLNAPQFRDHLSGKVCCGAAKVHLYFHLFFACLTAACVCLSIFCAHLPRLRTSWFIPYRRRPCFIKNIDDKKKLYVVRALIQVNRCCKVFNMNYNEMHNPPIIFSTTKWWQTMFY